MEKWVILLLFAQWVSIVAGLWLLSGRSSGATDVRKLEARMKAIETEWLETYDKLNRLAGRMTKERGLLNAKPTDVGDGSITTTPPTRMLSRSEVLLRARGGG